MNRYTAFGSELLENDLSNMVQEIKNALQQKFSPNDYKAVLIVGSYGKGEGGVETRNGKEYPHNNFDLLMVSQSDKNIAAEKAELDWILRPLSEKYGIGFDTSVIPVKRMIHSLPTLLWYELYHGHKCILGDNNFIPRLPFGDFRNVPIEEFQALIVNRGTLMIINDLLLQSNQELTRNQKRIVIKHLMKAIIGFGDASLYFLSDRAQNEYHWSYRERQKRVETLNALSESFRRLYAMASNFRLRPDYNPYLPQDLLQWSDEIRKELETVFLECEKQRLGQPSLQADDWMDAVLNAKWRKKLHGFKQWLKSWQGLRHPTLTCLGRSMSANAAFLCLSRRQRLNVIFPMVAFGWGDPKAKAQAAKYLDSESIRKGDLAKAYLKQWSHLGDINFKRSQTEWGNAPLI